jgi:hypothetical protein
VCVAQLSTQLAEFVMNLGAVSLAVNDQWVRASLGGKGVWPF